MRYFIGLSLFMMYQLAFAVVIAPNTIVNTPVTFANTVIDLTRGNFIIKNGASLVIQNSKIIGRLSKENPFLMDIEDGSLKMIDNDVSIDAPDLPEHDMQQSLENVIKIGNARLQLSHNNFVMNDPFRAGLLISNSDFVTNNVVINDNYIEGFHGAIYLINSNYAFIKRNIMKSNSYGNIVISGNNGKIISNKIYFSGRDRLGNSMDIINSSDMLISDNLLFMPGCHGIYVMLSNNIAIMDNNITGGITYAITLLSQSELTKDDYVLKSINRKKISIANSSNIVVSNNYMSQNRYGMQARNIINLEVSDNYFSQRFDNAAQRLFWTNNNNILQDINGLIWKHNIYKEAFTQDNAGDNSNTKMVDYPVSGGISL